MSRSSNKRPPETDVSDSSPKRPRPHSSNRSVSTNSDNSGASSHNTASHELSSPSSPSSSSLAPTPYSASSSSSSGHRDRDDLCSVAPNGDAVHSVPSEDEENEPIILTRPKPPMYRIPTSDLSARLAAFLPALRAANDNLERDIAAGKVMSAEIHDDSEDVDDRADGEGRRTDQYIEMNLGLGVLEQKSDDESEASSDRSPDSSNGESEGTRWSRGDTDVLDRLMGNKPITTRPIIEEMEQ
ncbi:hypothetical protein CISG_01629 [Coccidioides immitis RMSCC 3703]|uniref:Uncharacterized protein n=1 Tax=Coccidioides immitis RMSCC 3703 TaxID=454286 RepID=A0A0J8R0D2_COCIT|nr:hypothetical protein CISG_01629 [Coccidioides immitis RMSCC 3703]